MKIGIDNCFDIDKFVKITTTQKALKRYADNFPDASDLKNEIPIFLDTNVLLEYYKISFTERKEIKQFLVKNKNRIYLTHQIEKEFLRHRISHINAYQKSLDEFLNSYQTIKLDLEKLKGGVINNFQHYVEKNKILNNDYENVQKELNDIYIDLSNRLKGIFLEGDLFAKIEQKEIEIGEIKKKLEGEADIERNDDLLDIISEFTVIPALEEDENTFLIEKYAALKGDYDAIKGDIIEKPKKSFPGCGEHKKTDKTGDFIIYHEILKFMKDKATDVVFLTSDVSKDDWLLRNKGELIPFTHYIINNYLCSEQIMYVFQASDKLRVSYDRIYADGDAVKESETNKEEIQADENGQESVEIPSDQNEKPKDENRRVSVKIVGNVNLDGYKKITTTLYQRPKITEQEFLNELEKSQYWAENYGDGFVGMDYFIKKILGFSKDFEMRYSYQMKDKLVAEGKVEVWTHNPTDGQYHSIEAIKICE
jgi:predicted nucleic acid-binding protein